MVNLILNTLVVSTIVLVYFIAVELVGIFIIKAVLAYLDKKKDKE